MRTDLVPVFGLNQDDCVEAPVKIVSRDEARAMKRAKDGWFFSNGKKFRLAKRVPVVVESERVMAPLWAETSKAISKGELLANAGIVDARVSNPRGTIQRARAKVRLYPYIFDELASPKNVTGNVTTR